MYRMTRTLLVAGAVFSHAACGETALNAAALLADPFSEEDSRVGPVAPTFAEWNVPHPRILFPNTTSAQNTLWTAATNNALTSTVVNSFLTTGVSFSFPHSFEQSYEGARNLHSLSEATTRCVLQRNLDPNHNQCQGSLDGLLQMIRSGHYQTSNHSIGSLAYEIGPDIAMLIALSDALFSVANASEQQELIQFAVDWYDHIETQSIPTGPASDCWYSDNHCIPLKTAQLWAAILVLGKNENLHGAPASTLADKIAMHLDMLVRATKHYVPLNGGINETQMYDAYSAHDGYLMAFKAFELRGYDYVDQTHLPSAGHGACVLSLFDKPIQAGDQAYRKVYGVSLSFLASLRKHPSPARAAKLRDCLWDRVAQYGGLDRWGWGQGENVRGWFNRFFLLDIALDATTRTPMEPFEYSTLSYMVEPGTTNPKQVPYNTEIVDGRYFDAFLINDMGLTSTAPANDSMRGYLSSGYWRNHQHEQQGEYQVQIAGHHAWTGPGYAGYGGPQARPELAGNVYRNLLLVDPSGGTNYADYNGRANNYYQVPAQTFTNQLKRAQLGLIDVVAIDQPHYVQAPLALGSIDSTRTVAMIKKNHSQGVAYTLDFIKGKLGTTGAAVGLSRMMARNSQPVTQSNPNPQYGLTFDSVPGGTQCYRHWREYKTSYSVLVDTPVNDIECGQSIGQVTSDCDEGLSEDVAMNRFQQHIYRQQATANEWLTWLHFHGATKPTSISSFSSGFDPTSNNVVGGRIRFGPVTDLIMFKKDTGYMEGSGVRTNADFVYARRDENTGQLLEFQALGVDTLEFGGNTIISSSEPIDLYMSADKVFIGSGHELKGFVNGVPPITLVNHFAGNQDVYIDRKHVPLGVYGLTVSPTTIELMGGTQPPTGSDFLATNGYAVADTYEPFFYLQGNTHPGGDHISTTVSHTAVVENGHAVGSFPLLGSNSDGSVSSSFAIQLSARSTDPTSPTTQLRVGTSAGDDDVASLYLSQAPGTSNNLLATLFVDSALVNSAILPTNNDQFGAVDLVVEPNTGLIGLHDSLGNLVAVGAGPTGITNFFVDMRIAVGGEVDWVALAEDTVGDLIPRNHAVHISPDGIIEAYAYTYFGSPTTVTQWRFLNELISLTAQQMNTFIGTMQVENVHYAPAVNFDPNQAKILHAKARLAASPPVVSILQNLYSTTTLTNRSVGTRIR